ncbi:MAG TPA: hypothetical protein VJS88_06085, partial [Chthoniobacterales bacterium]|nr:hypothetical protein [Chthoniobacterales bacterium]
DPVSTRLESIDHARDLLDQERRRLLQGEQDILLQLINPGCDDADCSSCSDYDLDAVIARAQECERRLDGRYRSAFNKLLFEVAECERVE